MKKDIEITVQKFEILCLVNDESRRAMGMLDGVMSCRQVARLFGCSPSTITRLLNHTEKLVPWTTVHAQDVNEWRLLIRIGTLYFSISVTGFSQHQKRLQRHLAGTSQELAATRQLYESDLRDHRPAMVTLLTPERRQNRLVWSRRHARWTQRNWNQVMFSHEARFCLSKPDGCERVWRRRGERYAECCVHQYNHWGGSSVMVWAGISFNHKSPLVVINGNITAKRYISDVLDPVMVPFLNTNLDITVIQQDNTRPHTARITRENMQQENVEVLPWPAYSPDLSPIEHLWDQLSCRLANRNPKPWKQATVGGCIAGREGQYTAGMYVMCSKHTVAISHTESCGTSTFGTTIMWLPYMTHIVHIHCYSSWNVLSGTKCIHEYNFIQKYFITVKWWKNMLVLVFLLVVSVYLLLSY